MPHASPASNQPPKRTAADSPPEPKARRRVRLASRLILLVVPLMALITGVQQLLSPLGSVELNTAQRTAVAQAYGAVPGQTPTRLSLRLDDPALWERLVAAAPGLAMGAALALLAYALWRIETHLDAGGSPFTARAQGTYTRANLALTICWALTLVVYIAPLVMVVDTGGGRPDVLGFYADQARTLTMMAAGVSIISMTMHRVYQRGRIASDELETIA